MVQSLWKSLAVPPNAKHRVTIRPSNPREMKKYVHSKTCAQMFIAALFIISKKWKQPKCISIDEWINKMYIHTMANVWQ